MTRTPPRVGVCHQPGGAANVREILAGATRVCQVVMLFREAVADRAADLVALAGRLFECHVLPTGGEIDVVAGLSLDAVTTFHDDELDLADVLDARVRGVEPASDSPWDKLVQRRRLAAAGLTGVRTEAVDSALEFVHQWHTLGGTAVLKPRRGASGRGIAFIGDDRAVREQLARRSRWDALHLEDRIAPACHPGGRSWLGNLISVETASGLTERHHLGVLDKLPVHVVPGAGSAGADAVSVQGDVLPSALGAETVAAAREYTTRILDVLGIRRRLSHTELALTPNGLEVVEVNGRLAGHTARLFRLVDGPDMVRVALHAAVGAPFDLAGPPVGTAAGLFPAFADPAGTVRSEVTRRHLRALPGVAGVDEIAELGRPKAATGLRMANLTVTAADRDELDRLITEVLNGLDRLFRADGGAASVLRTSG